MQVMYVSHRHEPTVQARPLNTVPNLHLGGGLKSCQIWQIEIETLYSCKWNWKFYHSFTTL